MINLRITGMTVIVNLLSRAGDTDNLNLELRKLDTGTIKNYRLDLTNWHMDNLRPDPLASIGIMTYEPIIPNVVGKVMPGSPAEKSGLLKDDQITAINDKPVTDWLSLGNKIY